MLIVQDLPDDDLAAGLLNQAAVQGDVDGGQEVIPRHHHVFDVRLVQELNRFFCLGFQVVFQDDQPHKVQLALHLFPCNLVNNMVFILCLDVFQVLKLLHSQSQDPVPLLGKLLQVALKVIWDGIFVAQ